MGMLFGKPKTSRITEHDRAVLVTILNIVPLLYIILQLFTILYTSIVSILEYYTFMCCLPTYLYMLYILILCMIM